MSSGSGEKRHNPRYIAGLAAAATAILVVGFLLKPRKPASEAPPPPSQIEMQRLARLAQRRSLDTMTEYFSEVAGDLAPRVVQVGAGTGSGILWEGDLVLTAGQGTPSPESTVVMMPGDHLLTVTREVAGPQLPLAAYKLPGVSPRSVDPIDKAGPLEAAEWVLAIWRREGELAFSPGHYLETRPSQCGELPIEEVLTSLALTTDMAGGGVFDLDGALAAVILPCEDGYAAVRPSTVARLVSMGQGLDGQILALYGMRTLPLDEALAGHLGVEEGAVVSEVWNGQRASASGLRPGDVIVELGEHGVSSPDDLRPLLLPPELGTRLARVRRGGKTVELDLTVGPGSGEGAEEGDHGVQLESISGGFVIGSVSPGSPGAEAGLRVGDRILRVDDRVPRNPTELRRALARRRPAFIELERGSRRLGMLLE